MTKLIVLLLSAAWLLAAGPKPKLVLAIVVDQFRYDYLTRFRKDYTGGLDRLLTKGAVFTEARYEHYPTVTAVGHSTFLSGATPAISGILANEWYDRESRAKVTSVYDPKERMLGAEGAGASPRRLLVSTLGDEMKTAGGAQPRVIGISLKDRGAILPVGHLADAAYWLDPRSGNFVSSTYYVKELPPWVRDYNARLLAKHYMDEKWIPLFPPSEPFHVNPASKSEERFIPLERSPFGNVMVEDMAELAITNEQLGKHEPTDLLAVSFSSNDYVGHEVGPDAREVRDMSVRTDRLFDKLFHHLESQIGMSNVLVVLTADHGVAPNPDDPVRRKMPGGRMPGVLSEAIKAALDKAYGQGSWIVGPSESGFYIDPDLIATRKLDRAEVQRTAAQAAMAVPHVFRVYTGTQLAAGAIIPDQVGRRVMNGFYAQRGPDLIVLLDPYWITRADRGTTHSTTFGYDTHVPVIFMGPGIKPGRYRRGIAPNDIAPTLAAMLEVETPSGSVGRVLEEALTSE